MNAWMSSIFGKFAIELRPLINVRIELLLNILIQIDQLRPNFVYI